MHSFRECGKNAFYLPLKSELKSLTYQGSTLNVEDIFSGRKNLCRFEASISS